MFDKINFLELSKAVLKRWWVIVIFTLVFGAAGYGYSKYVITKKYASVGRMYIGTYRNVKDESDSSNDERDLQSINASQRSVLTCIEVLKSETVLKQVKERTGVSYSTAAIRNMLTLKSVSNTEVLQVRAETTNYMSAKLIVDELMKVGEVELKRIVGVSTAEIIDEGTVNKYPVFPQVGSYLMMGLAAGFLLGAFLIILIALLDNRVKSEEDLKVFEIPVIGVIPEIE